MMYQPPRSKTNLFIPDTFSSYSAVTEMCSTLPATDYRIASAGVYLPVAIYMAWKDGQRPQKAMAPSVEELSEMYRPGTLYSTRMARSELLSKDEN